jgi:hypothetical protein
MRVVVPILAAAVFVALIVLDPTALARLGWLSVSGRMGVAAQCAAIAAVVALWVCVSLAFLWRPAADPPKAAVVPPPQATPRPRVRKPRPVAETDGTAAPKTPKTPKKRADGAAPRRAQRSQAGSKRRAARDGA